MTLLHFRPKERAPEVTVEKWRADVVFDLLEFCYGRGILVSLDFAISMANAIGDGFIETFSIPEREVSDVPTQEPESTRT